MLIIDIEFKLQVHIARIASERVHSPLIVYAQALLYAVQWSVSADHAFREQGTR